MTLPAAIVLVLAQLAPGPSAPPPGAPVVQAPRPPAPPPPAPPGEGAPSTWREVFGWTAVGVGAASVVSGVVVASVAAARYANLTCDDDLCAPAQHEAAAAYNDLRMPAGLLIVGGVIAAGVGVPFLVLDPGGATVAVGPGCVHLRGTF